MLLPSRPACRQAGKMKALKLLLLLTVVYILQIVIFSRFAILGVKPDLLLIVTTLYAVTYGAEKGFLVGLICGLVQDILSGSIYFHTLSKALLGFIVGTFKESVFGTEETVALTAVFVATVTNYLLELLLLFFFFGKPLASPSVILVSLIISCLFNSILAPLIFPAVRLSSQFLAVE